MLATLSLLLLSLYSVSFVPSHTLKQLAVANQYVYFGCPGYENRAPTIGKVSPRYASYEAREYLVDGTVSVEHTRFDHVNHERYGMPSAIEHNEPSERIAFQHPTIQLPPSSSTSYYAAIISVLRCSSATEHGNE